MEYSLLESLRFFVPEIVLILGVLSVVVVDLVARPGGEEWVRGPISTEWPARVALITVLLAFVATLAQLGAASGSLFSRNLVLDEFAIFRFPLLDACSRWSSC